MVSTHRQQVITQSNRFDKLEIALQYTQTKVFFSSSALKFKYQNLYATT